MDKLTSASIAALDSSVEQLKSLLPNARFALFSADGTPLRRSDEAVDFGAGALASMQRSLASGNHEPRILDVREHVALIPVSGGGELAGALLTTVERQAQETLEQALDRTWRRLRPMLDRLGRQFARTRPEHTDQSAHRAQELEWLLGVSAELRGAADTSAAMFQMLVASVELLVASFGVLSLPQRRLSLTSASRVMDSADDQATYRRAEPYIMSYMRRRRAPLVTNRSHADGSTTHSRCKILAVPVASRNDKQIGVIAFCRPLSAVDFNRRDLCLAQHVAGLLAAVLDARHDPATGLLTRAALEQEAAEIIAAHSIDEPHTVVHADIDHLHAINETFGFDFGDQAIAFVARLLPSHLPGSALCARVAGDRFVAFLPKCDEARALHLAQSFQRQVNSLAFGLHPRRITLSMTCGIAGVPLATVALPKAMAAAELACRTAKERGRGCSEVYLDVDDSMMHRNDDILGAVRLRAAIEKDRLRMFAQRIAPLCDRNRTSGIECLARLIAEDGATIPPADFLSAAARYQMLRALDEWMLDHVLKVLQPYAPTLFHGEIGVALNISEQSLHDDDFLRFAEECIGSYDLCPSLITFEISESAAVRDLSRTVAVMRRLRKLGCRIALDDFGTRIASIAHLQSLRPDRVKIDGTLVRHALDGAQSESALQTIVLAAARTCTECVAKHVESDAVACKLRELGVGYVQGNWLHEAQPMEALLESLLHEEQRQLKTLYGGSEAAS